MKRFALLTLVSFALVACSSVLSPERREGGTLADARRLLLKARTDRFSPQTVNGYRMRAAELAWDQFVSGPAATRFQALSVLNDATAQLAPGFIGEGKSGPQRFAFLTRRYEVVRSAGGEGIWNAGRFEKVTPASRVSCKLCQQHHTIAGVGAPLVTEWEREPNKKLRPFVPERGPLSPVTAVLTFGKSGPAGMPRRAVMTYYDPSVIRDVRVNGNREPLAADFTAPITGRTNEVKELWLGITGMLNPTQRDASLTMLEPYDPNRLTVVLVHGLLSHPRMWRNVINELESDPELRGKLQFWVFYYPTGWPVLYSSLRLRDELHELESVLPGQEHMVFIGHSMGGLLTRMQVISPHREIWNTLFGKNADRIYARLPRSHIVKRGLLFDRNPEIERAIFVCVPQRGSNMADLRLTVMVSKLVRLPSTILGVVVDLTDLQLETHKLTSLYDLSTANPLYKALDHVPIAVPYHSIIGDRGRCNTPKSSDGVVPYWSSHLSGAESELIVPSNHGAYEDPRAIAEMRRILKEHLRKSGRKHSV